MELPLDGLHTLLVTPFDGSGEFDPKSMGTLIDHVTAAGASLGVVVLGTTGEFFGLTERERVEVARVAVDAAKGCSVPVTVGVGATGTAGSVELTKAAEAVGAACVMVVPPIYFDLADAAQLRHFVTVAKATTLPVMIYDGAGGIPVSAEIIKQASAEAPNIRYAKLALPDPGRITRLRELAPGVTIFAGDDTSLVSGLRSGASASAIATGNIQAPDVAAIHDAVSGGRLADAEKIFREAIIPSVVATSVPKNEFIARFKVVLAHLGVISSDLARSPLSPISDDAREQLLQQMSALGIIR